MGRFKYVVGKIECYTIHLYTDVEVWNILAELVQVCTSPCPPNPFSVDLDYFDSLPAAERLLATSAMLNLLKSIVLSGQYSYSRHSKLPCLTIHHFESFNLVLQFSLIFCVSVNATFML